jgi:hypothetical protein
VWLLLEPTFRRNAVPNSQIYVVLMIEAIRSYGTSVVTIATRHHILEDGIFHSHRRENLKFYIQIAKLSSNNKRRNTIWKWTSQYCHYTESYSMEHSALQIALPARTTESDVSRQVGVEVGGVPNMNIPLGSIRSQTRDKRPGSP